MFQIIVDSAANIPAELVKKYKIKVLSFINFVNGKEVTCFDPDLSPEEERQKGHEYYDAVRQGADVKTGLISTAIFEDAFRSAMENNEDVLYFSLSKNISGNFNSARLATEDLMRDPVNGRKIRLIDSLNASLAQGILAIYASEMRDKGMEVDEVADILETYPAKMNGVFTVGDLKYLSRTGRLSGATALVGNLLSIKPILRGNKDGFIVQYKKCRGRKAALNELVSLVCDNIVEPEKQIIGIAHADAYEDSLYVMDKIQKKISVREFINTSYDFCTGSHVGPDTIALFFMAKDRELGANKPALTSNYSLFHFSLQRPFHAHKPHIIKTTFPHFLISQMHISTHCHLMPFMHQNMNRSLSLFPQDIHGIRHHHPCQFFILILFPDTEPCQFGTRKQRLIPAF